MSPTQPGIRKRIYCILYYTILFVVRFKRIKEWFYLAMQILDPLTNIRICSAFKPLSCSRNELQSRLLFSVNILFGRTKMPMKYINKYSIFSDESKWVDLLSQGLSTHPLLVYSTRKKRITNLRSRSLVNIEKCS